MPTACPTVYAIMKYRDCMIVWTPTIDSQANKPTAGRIELGPHPPRNDDWGKNTAYSGGCCFLDRKRYPRWQQVAMMLTDFHQIVVRDGLDPQRVHAAFLAIDEYRAVISPDIDGAEPEIADADCRELAECW